MSLTMQHIIVDAQTLCSRLKDHESLADRLISQAQSLYKQVDAMKQYEEEVGQLNDVAHQKPRDALVQGIQQDNRHLRELQQENKELRNSLDEHRYTLEVVMSHYRKQVTQLMEINKADRRLQRSQAAGVSAQAQSRDAALLEQQSEKIQEMAQVMRRAVELDEQSEHRAQEAIAQLTKENKGLRELLRVIYSYNPHLVSPPAGQQPPSQLVTGDADSSGSLSDSPCSQTIRRRGPADGPPGGSETNFQTVRRRLPAAAKAAENPDSAAAESPPAGGGPVKQPAAAAAGQAATSPVKTGVAEGKTPSAAAGSPLKSPSVQAAPATSPTKSPGETKAPPVPSSAPPKLPALAARSPVTVKAAPVTIRSPPTTPAPPAPVAQSAAPPAGAASPTKAGSPPAAKPSPERQSSPETPTTQPKTKPAQQPAAPKPKSDGQPANKPAPST